MSNKQYMPGSCIPTFNRNGTILCEACCCAHQGTVWLPHYAGSYDCVEALGHKLHDLFEAKVQGFAFGELVSLENKLRGEYLAADERIMKDVQEIRTDLREFAVSEGEKFVSPMMVLASQAIVDEDTAVSVALPFVNGKSVIKFSKPVIFSYVRSANPGEEP